MNRTAVTVYTLSGCHHCARVRDLLRRRGISFTEVSGDGVSGFRGRLRERTGRSTVPQIVIGGTAIGGASDLARLERRGVLLPLVHGQPFPHAIARRRLYPVGLLATLVGGSCGIWRFGVDRFGRNGRVVERIQVRSAEEAAELALFLNERQAAA